jgi:hypothetical protein
MSILSRLRAYVQRAERWYLTTPDRSLDEAYDAALAIRAIEEQHFQGQKIGSEVGGFSQNALIYFQAELKKHLKTIRIRLTEFRLSRATIDVTNPDTELLNLLDSSEDYTPSNGRYLPPKSERPSIILEKLKFIDEVLDRYQPSKPASERIASLVPLEATASSSNGSTSSSPTAQTWMEQQTELAARVSGKKKTADLESLTDKTGVLPRSILSTLNRLKRDLDPRSAIMAADMQRLNSAKAFIAIRFLLVLISVTLLVQLSVRHVFLDNRLPIGNWISDKFRVEQQGRVFINSELEERALQELSRYEEHLKFEQLLAQAMGGEERSSESIEEAVANKAQQLAGTFAQYSGDAVKNWIADLAGLITFILIFLNSRREIEIVKSFLDEIVYGLSDSAKAFIIILLTDMFVGFHSPHGWEVLLEGVAEHLGLPPSRSLIFIFIATFPVILDTIFKYWIFRYLNRVSPSSVATYKEMNE